MVNASFASPNTRIASIANSTWINFCAEFVILDFILIPSRYAFPTRIIARVMSMRYALFASLDFISPVIPAFNAQKRTALFALQRESASSATKDIFMIISQANARNALITV